MKIGLEVHVQLNTKSKLFCGCSNKHSENPNSLTCEYCIGSPGSKPVLNKKAIDHALKIALVLKCRIPGKMIFSRKNYFYPDMGKNYQITQYDFPIASDGFLEIDGNRIGITRIQLEEDPARTVHMKNYALVDYNRSGVPLCEIVTEPDFSDIKEARVFLQRLSSMLEYLDVMDPSVEGSLRIDANISTGSNRVEIKNISGFREVEKALNYEMIRQKSLIKRGQEVKRETRGWDDDASVTRSMRSKEEEADYGYITEPDLPLVSIEKLKVEEIRSSLPEMPHEKIERYMKDFEMNEIMARSIASEIDLALFFEDVVKKMNPKLAAKWFAGYLKKTLNYSDMRISDTGIKSDEIILLINSVEDKKITEKTGEMILRERVKEDIEMKDLIEKNSVVDEGEIKLIIEEVIKENNKVVEEYKNGKKESLNFLIGEVMKKTQGKSNPDVVRKNILDVLK